MSSGRRTGHHLLIVDKHRTFAEALAARVRAHEKFGRVTVADVPGHALNLIETDTPEVVLLDTCPGPVSWLDFLHRVTVERPDVAVLVISGSDDVHEVIAALDGNARGWISKSASMEDLVEAIGDVLADRVWLPRDRLGPVLRELLARPASARRPPPSFVDSLTRRQFDVMECLAAGMSRKQIADHLVLSPHTVRTHVQEMLRKANVHSTLAALALAREAGYFRSDQPAMATRQSIR